MVYLYIMVLFLFCLPGEKPIVVVYDLHSLRKRKILSSPDVQSEEFISIAFSPDSKYLATQSSSPEWNLLYWTWEKAKVIASVKTSNPQGNAAVNQVSAAHFLTDIIYRPGKYCICIFYILLHSYAILNWHRRFYIVWESTVKFG